MMGDHKEKDYDHYPYVYGRQPAKGITRLLEVAFDLLLPL